MWHRHEHPAHPLNMRITTSGNADRIVVIEQCKVDQLWGLLLLTRQAFDVSDSDMEILVVYILILRKYASIPITANQCG